MNRNLVKGATAFALLLGASLVFSGTAQAGFFSNLFKGKHSSCCAPEPVCCEPAPEPCCAPEPACCGAAPVMESGSVSSQGYELAPGETIVPGSVTTGEAPMAAPAAEAPAAEVPAAPPAPPAAPSAGDAVPSSSDAAPPAPKKDAAKKKEAKPEPKKEAADEAAPPAPPAPAPTPDANTDI